MFILSFCWALLACSIGKMEHAHVCWIWLLDSPSRWRINWSTNRLHQRPVYWKKCKANQWCHLLHQDKNLHGLAVFFDFEKNIWFYRMGLFKFLEKLNFSPDFKTWVQTFYFNITSWVIIQLRAWCYTSLPPGVRYAFCSRYWNLRACN